MTITEASADDLRIIADQLGRVPRGVIGVAARCICHAPLVVATAARLDDGTPFPTTFYLSQPAAVKGCSTLEAAHWMDELNRLLSDDEELRARYAEAHRHYVTARENIEVVDEIRNVSAGGMPTRVKCLHALLGHALAAGPGVNPIGDLTLVELHARGLWSREDCRCLPGQTGNGE